MRFQCYEEFINKLLLFMFFFCYETLLKHKNEWVFASRYTSEELHIFVDVRCLFFFKIISCLNWQKGIFLTKINVKFNLKKSTKIGNYYKASVSKRTSDSWSIDNYAISITVYWRCIENQYICEKRLCLQPLEIPPLPIIIHFIVKQPFFYIMLKFEIQIQFKSL